MSSTGENQPKTPEQGETNSQTAKSKWQKATTPVKAGIIGGIGVLGLVLLSCCTAGCIVPLWWYSAGSGKLTQANFERIKTDMSEKEVEDILGKGETYLDVNAPGMNFGDVNIPGQSMSGKKWESGTIGLPGYKLVTVTFKNGKINGKMQLGLK